MLTDSLLVVAGVVLLAVGGHLFVAGSARLAQALGIPPVVVGVVVIGFGTSAPEMVASVLAAVQDRPGVAFGNLVGSNISNIGLVLGTAALIRPAMIAVTVIRREALLATGAAILFVVAALDAKVTLVEGGLLLVAFIGAMGWLLWLAWHERQQAAAVVEEDVVQLVGQPRSRKDTTLDVGRAVAGLAMVLLGAELTIRGAVGLALAAGVDEAFIGLTVVGIGTSLPELVTAVIAASRGESDLIVGNVLGSNVFNLLLIGGTVGIISDHPLPEVLLNPGLPVLAIGSLVLLLFMRRGFRLVRWEAALLMVGYASYIGLLARQL